MSDLVIFEELVRHLAAAMRALALYQPAHPFVERTIDQFATGCARTLGRIDTLVIGFLGDEIVVNDTRLSRSNPALVGLVRGLREREVEKLTFERGVSRDELRSFLTELVDSSTPVPLQTRLEQRRIRHIHVGRIVVEEADEQPVGLAAARKVYASAVETAERLWHQTQAGDLPDPAAARRLIDSLAKLVHQDRTSLMALTALKRYDTYTFTHMVNVAVLSMAQARSLGIEGSLLREFGFAALMHDIGKVHTPTEILNKPDRLTKEEFDIMKRHVIDGAHILRRTPEVPALAPIVAFEHHLKQDLSGYPEGVAARQLNLCTMIVTVADVFDALRSHRIYREGLPTERIKAIMARKNDPTFHPRLLRRFVNLVGLYPVGTLVRLTTDELAVVVHEHPGDPFRPQVKVVIDRLGTRLEEPFLVNTWERNARGEYERAVVEAVDHEPLGLDPLVWL